MTAGTDSYRALVERMRELDGVVFTVSEAEVVREAADARLFGDEDQIDRVTRALELLETLVDAVRLSSRTCRQLGDWLLAIEPAGDPSLVRAQEPEQA